jgi:colanic acid/amylovoran biosynthesis glycosyltransferase
MTASVGYVLTHYPRVAQTFIAREIDDLEAAGWTVHPLSINPVIDSDLDATGGREKAAATFYIKSAGATTALRAIWRAARRSPGGFVRLAWRAVRTAGTDPKAMLWRLFHLAEGAVVWDHCRTGPVRHLHAHFGQTPATIAWFAAEVGNLGAASAPGERWTWSFTIHGFQDFVNERDARLDLKARHAAFVVCVSDFTRSQLMRVSDPSCWDRFAVVRCGIDLRAFSPRAQRPPSDPVRIVTVARLSPEKGHVVLLEALRLLTDRGLRAEVEMIGSGEFRDHVAAHADRLGIGEQVHLVGELEPPEVIEHLRSADIFCLPSFAEGLPVSIMEAMAIGVPVVSTYISGIPELAVHQRTALTVPAGSATALAEALAELIDDPGLGDRLAKAARLEVEEHHSSPTNVARLADLLARARLQEPTGAP